MQDAFCRLLRADVGQLGDDDLRARMGEAAFAAVASRQGALGRTLALIEEHLAAGAAPAR